MAAITKSSRANLPMTDLRKFPPLRADHPALGMPCGICQHKFEPGDETTLLPKEHPPEDGRIHTVEGALCHWACASAVARLARIGEDIKLAWLPPVNMKQAPVNHFHTLYVRLAEINDGLLVAAAKDPDIAVNSVFGELLGSCAELSNATARMTRMLEHIRRDFPNIWGAWCDAVEHQPEPEPDR